MKKVSSVLLHNFIVTCHKNWIKYKSAYEGVIETTDNLIQQILKSNHVDTITVDPIHD